MLAHLTLTGDVSQQRAWRVRVDTIRQTQAIERETDPELRSLLLRDRVWQRMRQTGRVAAVSQVAMATAWMSWLVPVYAVGHGFGWLAASAFLLPVPLAWKAARRVFEKSALEGMRALSKKNDPATRLTTLLGAIPRAALGGFTFGFILVFLQGLISWFMTPMPTIGLELMQDFFDACVGGAITGTASTVLAPLFAREPPPRTELLPAKLDELE
jgi:hypothetical protein